MSSEFATNVIGTLFKTKSTLSWVALLRIQQTCALSSSTCLALHPQVVHHILRDSMNQADVLGLAKFVPACLKCSD
eukprot:1158105-Pelagomonas_calceolata.AAC.1